MGHPDRKASLLEEVLEHRLALYALAVGAALAVAPGSEGKVVFTHADLTVGRPSHPHYIDLDNDGVADVYLQTSVQGCTGSPVCVKGLHAYPLGASNGFVDSSSRRNPAALARGANIGPANSFTRYTTLAAANFGTLGFGTSYYGNFLDTNNRFLGIRFLINGEIHYGWVGFRVARFYRAVVSGWAYETEPNKTIIAGNRGKDEDSADLKATQPTALELLALGHTAIAERQRRLETIQGA